MDVSLVQARVAQGVLLLRQGLGVMLTGVGPVAEIAGPVIMISGAMFVQQGRAAIVGRVASAVCFSYLANCMTRIGHAIVRGS